MALVRFEVGPIKALQRAMCDAVPRLMVIAGPNGVGKSTLMYAIHQRNGSTIEADTQILYQPPHRAIRRQQVRRRWIGLQTRNFADLIAGTEVSGFEGLNIQFPSRSPDNVDEAGSTIKYELGKLENRRQAFLADLVDSHRERARPLRTKDLPDIYAPLRNVVSELLPHLTFQRVDFTDEENIRVAFHRADEAGSVVLDLDDLSSGEKAIVLLFLPLVEGEMNALLTAMIETSRGGAAPVLPDRVFLVDEPEQHLHPDLQARLLGYLRRRTREENIQVVLTTHSPTLLDQALDDELYVLNRPAPSGVNQLSRVASNADRLDALKELVGNPFVVTTGRSVVLVEGPPATQSRPTDVRLLDILHPTATRFAFVPVGGRGNVIAAVGGLREYVPEEQFGISVLGLVDRDRHEEVPPGVVAWPVCMIENLLLDPESLGAGLVALGGAPIDTDEITTAIDAAAHLERDAEVRLRVMERLRPRMVRIRGLTVEEVRRDLDTAVEGLRSGVPADEQLAEVIRLSAEEVDQALGDGSYLQTFRGKEILRRVYLTTGLTCSYEEFVYAVADEVARRNATAIVLDKVFEELAAADRARITQTGNSPQQT